MTTPVSDTPVVSARALAKINLHLVIHDRRSDGYHNLTTVFQSIALHDTLVVESHDGPFVLQCGDPHVPVDETNLVWRAATALAGELGRGPLSGLRVTLEKHVPTQAGLGGGSADAMAIMRALGAHWGVSLDRALLTSVGRRLGADVAFFVEGGTALGTGRGDEVTPLADLPDCALAIVRPPFGVATADAYRWVAEGRGDRQPRFTTAAAERDRIWPATSLEWPALLATVHNDFEPVVEERLPVVGDITSTLRDAGAVRAFLSGSGSAVVGLFASDEQAKAAGRSFEGRAGWRSWTSRTVGREAYATAVAPTTAQ